MRALATNVQSLETLDDDRGGTSSTVADGSATVSRTGALEKIRQRHDDARTARSDRMAQSDGAALHVDLGVRNVQELHRHGSQSCVRHWLGVQCHVTGARNSLTRTFMLAIATTLKASLISQKSTSEVEMPARCSAIGAARAGAMVNSNGARSASAKPAMRARGFKPRLSARLWLINNKADAPSLRVDELAAVTVPSLVKAARSFGTLLKSMRWYSYDSDAHSRS